MSLDNQLRKHTSISTVFGSSDERRTHLINNIELNNRLHGTADFRYACRYNGWEMGNQL